MKQCGKCSEIKEFSEFHKNKHRKDGLCFQCKACTAKYQKANADKLFEQRIQQRDLKQEYNRAYYAVTRAKRVQQAHVYDMNRRKIDPTWRLARNLRSRIWNALKRKSKAGSAIRDLGCSIDQLKSHLEQQFQPGMSWENYGEWHIDHKRPLASFDLQDRSQFLEACHFSNLQPLWAAENLKKGAS